MKMKLNKFIWSGSLGFMVGLVAPVAIGIGVAMLFLLRHDSLQVLSAIQQDVRGRRVWNFDIISRVLCFSGVKQNV